MYLVVGLGNPGRRYRGTRHNLGLEVIDALARRWGVAVDRDEGFAETGRATVDGHRVLLAKPQTYVNVSGAAVADLRRRHRIRPDHLMVVVDDLDLPLAAVRVREKGSHGGHNGLRSVIEALATTEFARVRIGIGRPPAGVDPAEFVLERPSAEEREALDAAVARAADGIALWVTEGVQAAMRYCHARPTPDTIPRTPTL
ncbi:MAG: aminoacyl-tRNA hydrolase [Armatimonadota bacterium]|nr:aminoacyl-tRNA hydrolase [Armatimonadota bacterium]